MSPYLFELPANFGFGGDLTAHLEVDRGETTLRTFPDGETYVRVEDDVDDRRALVLATLDHPDDKILPLIFLAETLRDLDADEVGLVAPYLAYMRQDRQFRPGEGVTSEYFARMISSHVDWLVTVDPHLHRHHSLDDIYTVPSRVVRAAPRIAEWIDEEVDQPLLVGPDPESEQWVTEVADAIHAPYVLLEKARSGDRQVDISVPDLDDWPHHTPVLVDDIISTANTMMQATNELLRAGMPAPVCVGVHGIFAGAAYGELQEAGAARIATTDTVKHPSNAIGVDADIAEAVEAFL